MERDMVEREIALARIALAYALAKVNSVEHFRVFQMRVAFRSAKFTALNWEEVS